MSDLFIPVVLGTAREGRESEKVAKYVIEFLQKQGVATQLVDVKDHLWGATIAKWDNDPRKTEWKAIMGRADGLIIVSPEYNYGYPGELKILLDSIYDEYVRKPVGICGVSGGAFGGTRMIQQLRQSLVSFEMVSVRNTVLVTNVKSFDGAQYDAAIAGMLEQLTWWGNALKKARLEAEQIPK